MYANFHPLTLTRPVDDLRIGILTIAQKWYHALGHPRWSRIVRPHLKKIFKHSTLDQSEPSLWINSRYLPSEALMKQIFDLKEGTCIKNDEITIAARADAATTKAWLQNGKPDFSSMLIIEGRQFRSIERLWDLFLKNAEEIKIDIKRLGDPYSNDHTISPHAILKNEDQIFIEDHAVIEPGAILTANDGPIYIGENATVKAGAIIRGPVAICKQATVKMGAKIYGGTTAGPVCKVGGEVNNSIFHSYSNKSHNGFVGSSLIGQWCNFGAGTTTSNLKNSYANISIADWQSRKKIETGQQFFGTVMGDHSKTAINSQLNTGTVCGLSCNIFSNDFPPHLIPSFSWVGSNVIQPYKIGKALETMQVMMARRDVKILPEYEKMMRYLFNQAQKSRN